MEIGRHLVLSTAHIRCATAELLDRWARLPATDQPLPVASTQYGWFIAATGPDATRSESLPEELPMILAFGRAHDCSYILFDCDGPLEPDLPRFPW